MKAMALAALTIAALAATPHAAAELPGIAPFTGSWHAHASGLTIASDGSGRLTYADISACPSECGGHDDYADAPQATVDFTLTAVSADTATGSAYAASDPGNDTAVEPVTITLVTGIGERLFRSAWAKCGTGITATTPPTTTAVASYRRCRDAATSPALERITAQGSCAT
jgi:hypothetical protein